MGKNITLREGDTSKQFTADKIKTNLVGGGTCNWIPEDEAVDYVDLKDHTFTAAGTFLPSQFNCDGFRQVKIDIPADVKEKTITANGDYYAADDECLVYSKVTVAVPGGGGGGPFTVRFFDDDRQTILQTDANVPYGGSASCTLLNGTTVGGLYFKGWNPSPTNVKSDMNCYPVRGDYVIDEGEIQDNWETICANKGAGYPLGSYKAFVVGMTIPADEIMCYGTGHNANDRTGYLPRENWGFSPNVDMQLNFSFHMVKVAEGEDNSTSTWLSSGGFLIPLRPTGNYSRWRDGSGEWAKQDGNVDFCITDFGDMYSYTQAGGYGTDIMHDWGSSFLRNFLNGFFFDHLATCFKDAIKEVNKSYKGYNTDIYQQKSRVEKTSLDKIWVPSVKELGARLELCTIGTMSPNTFADIVEINGMDYSSVYSPTYPSAGSSSEYAITRTSVQGAYGQAYDYNVVRMNTAEANALQSASYRWNGNTSQRYIPIGFCL